MYHVNKHGVLLPYIPETPTQRFRHFAAKRGPGTRRFAQNLYHATMATLLLAVIVGLCLAARGLTP